MRPPAPALDEFEQREADARAQARAEGYRLGEPPTPDELRSLAVIE